MLPLERRVQLFELGTIFIPRFQSLYGGGWGVVKRAGAESVPPGGLFISPLHCCVALNSSAPFPAAF